jgi:hypothetical protein
LQLRITLPESAAVVDATPTPTRIEANRLFYEIELSTNIDVSIRYR